MLRIIELNQTQFIGNSVKLVSDKTSPEMATIFGAYHNSGEIQLVHCSCAVPLLLFLAELSCGCGARLCAPAWSPSAEVGMVAAAQ